MGISRAAACHQTPLTPSKILHKWNSMRRRLCNLHAQVSNSQPRFGEHKARPSKQARGGHLQTFPQILAFIVSSRVREYAIESQKQGWDFANPKADISASGPLNNWVIRSTKQPVEPPVRILGTEHDELVAHNKYWRHIQNHHESLSQGHSYLLAVLPTQGFKASRRKGFSTCCPHDRSFTDNRHVFLDYESWQPWLCKDKVGQTSMIGSNSFGFWLFLTICFWFALVHADGPQSLWLCLATMPTLVVLPCKCPSCNTFQTQHKLSCTQACTRGVDASPFFKSLTQIDDYQVLADPQVNTVFD